MHRRLGFLILALLVAPTLSALTPTASAQTGVLETRVTVSIEDPGRALVPGRNETVPLSVNYLFPAGSMPEPDPNTRNGTKNTTIRLTLKQVPSWVTEAHLYPDVVEVEVPLDRQGAGGNRVVNGISVNLTLDPLAPALQREDIIVVAEAEANGNLAGARGENPGTKVRADIVAILNVTTTEPMVVVPGGRWSTVTYTVANEGNYDVIARLNVTLKPENSEVRFPNEIELKIGESKQVDVEVRLPWTEAEAGSLELEATPVLPDDDGKPATMEVDVQGTSAVPGPALAPLLLTMAGLAAWRRR